MSCWKTVLTQWQQFDLPQVAKKNLKKRKHYRYIDHHWISQKLPQGFHHRARRDQHTKGDFYRCSKSLIIRSSRGERQPWPTTSQMIAKRHFSTPNPSLNLQPGRFPRHPWITSTSPLRRHEWRLPPSKWGRPPQRLPHRRWLQAICHLPGLVAPKYWNTSGWQYWRGW